MSNEIGQKVTVQFSEDLVGDVTGMTPIPINIGDYFRPIGTTTGSSRYSSTYDYSKAFDGNIIGSYWYVISSGTQWIQIQIAEHIWITGFRWYVSTYPPKEFIVEGSSDGINWVTLLSDYSDASEGWKEFLWEPNYGLMYFRWSITSRYSSYLRIYEIQLRDAKGQEGSFHLEGQEYQYVNGPLLEKSYQIISVDNHQTLDKALTITLHPQSRFNNVDGNLTLTYDHTKGNLRGLGGPVDSFVETFIPTDLQPKPNPSAFERVITEAALETIFTRIYYKDRYSDEAFNVNATCSLYFFHVDEQNP